MSEERARWRVSESFNDHRRVDIYEGEGESSRHVGAMRPADAAQVIADRERVQAVREALEPIMAYLAETVRIADPEGKKLGDVLAKCNDTMLRASDIRRLQAALARPAATGDD
jgi:succinyl-CoA synthetase alpha subunit